MDKPGRHRRPSQNAAMPAPESAVFPDRSISIRATSAALASGILLYFLVAGLEHAAGTDLAGSVLVEEACKLALLSGFALLGSKLCPRMTRKKGPAPELPAAVEGLIWGLAAIVVFAATENLAYLVAFPGNGIFLRLAWSEPVHLVSALAEAEAIWLIVKIGKAITGQAPAPEAMAGKPPIFGMVAGMTGFLALAVAWHLVFNLAADGPIQALEHSGDEAGLAWRSAILGALIANLAAMAALAYHFAHRVIVGGFLYGAE